MQNQLLGYEPNYVVPTVYNERKFERKRIIKYTNDNFEKWLDSVVSVLWSYNCFCFLSEEYGYVKPSDISSCKFELGASKYNPIVVEDSSAADSAQPAARSNLDYLAKVTATGRTAERSGYGQVFAQPSGFEHHPGSVLPPSKDGAGWTPGRPNAAPIDGVYSHGTRAPVVGDGIRAHTPQQRSDMAVRLRPTTTSHHVATQDERPGVAVKTEKLADTAYVRPARAMSTSEELAMPVMHRAARATDTDPAVVLGALLSRGLVSQEQIDAVALATQSSSSTSSGSTMGADTHGSTHIGVNQSRRALHTPISSPIDQSSRDASATRGSNDHSSRSFSVNMADYTTESVAPSSEHNTDEEDNGNEVIDVESKEGGGQHNDDTAVADMNDVLQLLQSIQAAQSDFRKDLTSQTSAIREKQEAAESSLWQTISRIESVQADLVARINTRDDYIKAESSSDTLRRHANAQSVHLHGTAEYETLSRELESLKQRVDQSQSGTLPTSSVSNFVNDRYGLADDSFATGLIQRAARRHCHFFKKKTGRLETAAEQSARIAIWDMLTESLSNYPTLVGQVQYIGDIRALVHVVARQGQSSRALQMAELKETLYSMKKERSETLATFLLRLEKTFEDYRTYDDPTHPRELLERDRCDALIIGIRKDARYNDALLKINELGIRRSYSGCIAVLQAYADRLEDTTLRAVRKAHNVVSPDSRGRTATPSDSANAVSGKRNAVAKPPLCNAFILGGSCSKAGCTSRHPSDKEMVAVYNRMKKRLETTTDSSTDKGPKEGRRKNPKTESQTRDGDGARGKAPQDNPEVRPCFNWRDRGECSRDSCPFSHEAKANCTEYHAYAVRSMTTKAASEGTPSTKSRARSEGRARQARFPSEGSEVMINWPDTPLHLSRGWISKVLVNGEFSITLALQHQESATRVARNGLPMSCITRVCSWEVGTRVFITDTDSPLNEATGSVLAMKGERVLILLDNLASFEAGAARTARVDGIHHSKVSAIRLSVNNSANITKAYSSRFIVDGGATGPGYVQSESQCVPGSIKKLAKPYFVEGFTGKSVKVTHTGTVLIKSNIPGSKEYILIPDMLIVHGSNRSLCGISRLDDLGYYADHGGGGVRIRHGPDGDTILALPRLPEGTEILLDTGTPIASLPRKGPLDFGLAVASRHPLYPIPDEYFVTDAEEAERVISDATNDATQRDSTLSVNLTKHYSTDNSLTESHYRLLHTSMHRVCLMREWDTGKTISGALKKHWCVHCQMAKSHAHSYRKHAVDMELSPLSWASADLKVDLPRSLHGYRHYMVIVEWWSEHVWIFPLRRKSEAQHYLLWWVRMAHARFPGHKLQNLRIDDGELHSNLVTDELNQYGTTVHVNLAAEHQQNAKVERVIRTVEEMRKAALLAGSAPDSHWEFAVKAVAHALVRMPSMRLLKQPRTVNGKPQPRPLTPHERWSGKRYKTFAEQHEFLYPPFSKVVAHIPRHKRSANAVPGVEAIYLCPLSHEYTEGTGKDEYAGHLVRTLEGNKYLTVRSLTCNTSEYPLSKASVRRDARTVCTEPKAVEFPAVEKQDTSDLPTPAPVVKQEQPLENAEHNMKAPRSPVAKPIEKPSPQLIPKDTAMSYDVPEQQNDTAADQAIGQPHDEDAGACSGMPSLETEVPPRTPNDTDVSIEVAEDGDTSVAEENSVGERSTVEDIDDSLLSGGVLNPSVDLPDVDDDPENEASGERFTTRSGRVSKVTPEYAELISNIQEQDRIVNARQTKFYRGQEVETIYGPARYFGVRAGGSGDIQVSYDGYSDPDAIWNLQRQDVWDGEEDDRRFDYNGVQLQPPPEPPPQGSSTANSVSLALTVHRLPLAAYQVSRSARPARRSIFHGKTMEEIIGKVPVDVVDQDLPARHYQTFGHPLRPLIYEGEERELQGLLGIKFCGAPQQTPQGVRPIDLMWVYKAKAFEQGESVDKFRKIKSRLTMMGNQERNAVTKGQAYAPTPNPAAYRILWASHLGIEGVCYRYMDIAQAYLSTHMKRFVHVRHPPGYVILSKNGQLTYRKRGQGEPPPKTTMPLLRALYGGMECGRLFYDDYVKWHVEHGFLTCQTEKCYIFLVKDDGRFIKILFHVDDSSIVYRGEDLYTWYKTELRKRYSFVEGPLTKLLGWEVDVNTDTGVIQIRVTHHIQKMLREFGMASCKAERSPTPSGQMPSEKDVPSDTAEQKALTREFDMYSAVGYLNYLQCIARPEISYPLKILSRFTQRYGRKHIQLAKHMMRWLKGTAEVPLVLRTGFPLYLQIFTDASHAGDVDTRRSMTGIVIKLAGNTVFWCCKYQKIVSHSSCESELMSLDKGATVGQYLSWIAGIMGVGQKGPIDIFVDNRSTIDITTNPIQPGRNLHVHARYFYVRDLVLAKEYNIWHLYTKNQIADVLCSFKGLPNFKQLYPLLIGCARIVRTEGDHWEWDTSLLQVM